MLIINQDKCLRCGMCTGFEPDVFEFNDEGDIEIKNDKITEDNKENVKEAIMSCPVGAIEKNEEKKGDN